MWRCERCFPGKTGCARASCQNALMCHATKPQRHGGDATPRCGGAQTQALFLRTAVSDLMCMRVGCHKMGE
jgi:hypothetical protein